MPWNGSGRFFFNQQSVNKNAPQVSGVYALFSEGVWRYFGESGNIQERLTQHLNNETNAALQRVMPEFFAFQIVPGLIQRKARQDALIREYWHWGLCNERLG